MTSLEISPRLRALMRYRKFAGETPRMLIGHSQYWVDDACIRAAERMGWAVHKTPMVMKGQISRDQLKELFESLVTFKPDFILTANLSGMDVDGVLARFYADLAIPHATWFVDEPRSIVMGKQAFASEYAVAFTWERAYIPYLKQAGFAAAHHLPLAADTTYFDAEPASCWTHDTTFVASSMTAFAAREFDRLAHWPQLESAVRDALDNGNVTRESFGEGLESIIDTSVLHSVDEHGRRQAELVCFIEGTRRLRHAFVNDLAVDGLEVYGDDGWRDAGIANSPSVHYAEGLPDLYRSSKINLNLTSIQMPTAVNQRVFDCPAAGGFLLTDAQADLETLFDAPNETARFTGFDEARDLIRYYNTHETERLAITRRARARIMAEHTYEHRLRSVVDYLQALYRNE